MREGDEQFVELAVPDDLHAAHTNEPTLIISRVNPQAIIKVGVGLYRYCTPLLSQFCNGIIQHRK